MSDQEIIQTQDKIKNALVGSSMTEDSNPLTAFFQVVLEELRKRLTPEEYQDLLKDCQEVKPR